MSVAIEAAEEGASSRGADRVVQRTVMRADQELDVRALYMDGVSQFAGGGTASRQSGGEHGESAEDATEAGGSDETEAGMTGFGRVTEGGAVVVEPARRVTFGTYFNAFPASYWRRWTTFSSVRLVVRLRGQGSVIVYR